MFVTNPIGIIGEAEAAKMLEAKGFRILEHNWRMGHLEVDLIAESKKEIVFAEVKARTRILNGKLPEANVDEKGNVWYYALIRISKKEMAQKIAKAVSEDEELKIRFKEEEYRKTMEQRFANFKK